MSQRRAEQNQPQSKTPTASEFEKLLQGSVRVKDAGLRNSIDAIRHGVLAAREDIKRRLPPSIKRFYGDDIDNYVVRMVELAIDQIRKAVASAKAGETPQLLLCTVNSIANAVREAGQDGLPIDGKLAYMVPYGNTAKYQPSYMGLVAVAKRTKQIRDAYTREVYANDQFAYGERDGQQYLDHQPVVTGERGEMVGAYAKILTEGGVVYEFMRFDELEKIRQSSKSPNSPAWKAYPDQMYRKIPLRRALKLYVDDPAFSAVVAADEYEWTANPEDFAELARRPVRQSTRGDVLQGSLEAGSWDADEEPQPPGRGKGASKESAKEPPKEKSKESEPSEAVEPARCKCGGVCEEDSTDTGEKFLACLSCGAIQ